MISHVIPYHVNFYEYSFFEWKCIKRIFINILSDSVLIYFITLPFLRTSSNLKCKCLHSSLKWQDWKYKIKIINEHDYWLLKTYLHSCTSFYRRLQTLKWGRCHSTCLNEWYLWLVKITVHKVDVKKLIYCFSIQKAMKCKTHRSKWTLFISYIRFTVYFYNNLLTKYY